MEPILGKHIVVKLEEFSGPFAFEGREKEAAFLLHASITGAENGCEEMVFDGCVVVESFWYIQSCSFKNFTHTTEIRFLDEVDAL